MVLPELDAINEPFWTGGRRGELLIARCDACRTWIHPPAPYCSACGGREVSPRPVSGRGVVYSFTVNHMPWVEGKDEWQRVIALVELDEQRALRVVTNLVDCDRVALVAGLPVEVTFRAIEDVHLPLFRPMRPSG